MLSNDINPQFSSATIYDNDWTKMIAYFVCPNATYPYTNITKVLGPATSGPLRTRPSTCLLLWFSVFMMSSPGMKRSLLMGILDYHLRFFFFNFSIKPKKCIFLLNADFFQTWKPIHSEAHSNTHTRILLYPFAWLLRKNDRKCTTGRKETGCWRTKRNCGVYKLRRW